MKEQAFLGTPAQMELIIEGLRKQIGTGRVVIVAYEVEEDKIMTAISGNPYKAGALALMMAEKIREMLGHGDFE